VRAGTGATHSPRASIGEDPPFEQSEHGGTAFKTIHQIQEIQRFAAIRVLISKGFPDLL
jgi:hypothetical protein